MDKRVLIIGSIGGLHSVLAQQLIAHELAEVRILDAEEQTKGVLCEEVVFDEVSPKELQRKLAASIYEATPQEYKVRPGGKGRNRGKHNREWWNK